MVSGSAHWVRPRPSPFLSTSFSSYSSPSSPGWPWAPLPSQPYHSPLMKFDIGPQMLSAVLMTIFQSKHRDFRMFGGLGGPWGGQPPPPLIPPPPPQHHIATPLFNQPPPWPQLATPRPPPMAPQHPPLNLPLLPAAATHPTPTPLSPPSPVTVLPAPIRPVQSIDVLQAALDTVAQAQGHIANLRHQLAPLQPTSRFTIHGGSLKTAS